MLCKKQKYINYTLYTLIIVLSIMIQSNSVIASSVTILKGNSAIKDNNTNMVYYKSGVVDSTGGVNLVAKDKNKGTTKTLTKVDANPFYLNDNYIYYTYNKAIYRIKTDGSNIKELCKPSKTTSLNIIGLDDDYVYYTDFTFDEDANKLKIGRVQLTGTKNTTIKELTDNNSNTRILPVFYNSKIHYITRNTNNLVSLTTITPDGKTTKTVVKSAEHISELYSNKNGLFYVYKKDSNTDYLIQMIDSSGSITTLATIDKEQYPYATIKLSSYDDNYLYYSVNSEIYQLTYDGKNHERIYDTKDLSYYETYIEQIFIKGNWMIILLDADYVNPTYCVKIDGSYSVSLGSFIYSNSFDVLSDTIYYRVVTIPGDDEDFSYNDENVYRKFTLPLIEYD